MITTRGKQFFKRYQANQAGQVIGAVSLGIGATAATLADERLQFEFARLPLDVVTYDSVNDKLVFKATIPQNVYGKVYEVGLWTAEAVPTNIGQEAKIITTFDSASEDWSGATFDNTSTRIGADSLRQAPAASSTATSLLTGLGLDFVDNTSQDTFVVAYNVDNSNATNIRIRFRTDASNYFEFTTGAPAVGYNFSSFTKGSATVVGTPDWATISEVVVMTVAGSGGAASVSFDGIRIENLETFNLDYGLVSRFILGTPINSLDGQILDIEYAMTVSV